MRSSSWAVLMRRLSGILACGMVLAMWGCSLPRAAVLQMAAYENVPVMQGAARGKVEIQPFIAREPWVHWDELPSVTVKIQTAQSQEDVLAWYRKALVAREWTLTEKEESFGSHGLHLATRKRSIGGVPWVEENFYIRFEPDGTVSLAMDADYVGAAWGRAFAKGYIEGSILSPPWLEPFMWSITVPMEFTF
jgi:hypothetical protein